MSDVLIEQDTMEDIGDAIREKLGVSDTYLPASMPAAIRSISGGGNEMELTKAEYDALSEAEKTNGTTYYITDAQSWTSKEVQPVIYSTDEREIGVWTDGKPLYQKTVTIDMTSISINDGDTFSTGITDADYIAIVEQNFWDGRQVTGQSGYYSSTPLFYFQSTNGAYMSFCVPIGDKTKVRAIISSGNSFSANAARKIYITLRYTKTTDQAGSGIYTPQGQLAVHYSTDEHVIGTWIDGKTIYEKTLTGLNISATTAWGTQITLISNIDTIIDIKARDQYGPRAASCQRLDANTFNFKLESGTATIIILTLRYTKTTS